MLGVFSSLRAPVVVLARAGKGGMLSICDLDLAGTPCSHR